MLNWSEIDTILLDMDGTLLDLNFDNHFWQQFVPLKYAQLHGLTEEEAKTVLKPQFQAMEGKLEWYCLDYWTEALSLNIAELKQEVSGLIAVHPHVIDFLEMVRNRQKRLILVTNAHRDSLDLKMQKTCLDVFFDRIVSSHDFGLAKEQPGFWQKLEDLLQFDRKRTLLVDDSLSVLRSANQFGLGFMVSISKPDSQFPARDIIEFPAVEDFRWLMQGL